MGEKELMKNKIFFKKDESNTIFLEISKTKRYGLINLKGTHNSESPFCQTQ